MLNMLLVENEPAKRSTADNRAIRGHATCLSFCAEPIYVLPLLRALLSDVSICSLFCAEIRSRATCWRLVSLVGYFG